MIKLSIVYLLVLLVCLSCSGTKSIYPEGTFGDKNTGNQRYLVTFKGYSSEDAQTGLYLRCSEIALQNGFRYFAVINYNQKTETKKMNMVFTVSEVFTYTNTIQLLEKPVAGAQNFDAYTIFHNHKKKLAKQEE